jgi:3'-5' exoribonuclease
MASHLLAQLTIGQQGETLMYIVECTRRFTQKNAAYADLTVCDSSGRRRAIKWNLTDQEAAALATGAVIHAMVEAIAPYNQPQGTEPDLNIRRFHPATDCNPKDFLPPRRSDSNADWARFGDLVRSIAQPDLARLLRCLFRDEAFRTDFCRAPAAQNRHHPYPGGLLEHSVEVAELCLDACRRLGGLDRDLLLTGGLLHDIGKTREMAFDTPGYSFTEAGGLLGHVMLGAEMVREAILTLPGFDPAVQRGLQHLILSHHGRKEWGAPVEPATPEALLLHSCDQISVQMFYCRDAMRTASNSPFQWVRTLDRRMYLTPCEASDETAPARSGEAGRGADAWYEEDVRPEIRIVAGGLSEGETPQMAALPIYGCIAAGAGIRCEQNLEGFLALPMTGRGDADDFLLRVTGDSMRDAHILDGDIVRIRPHAGQPREGDIVAALVNGDATVKRFHRDGGRILLKAENPAHRDIPVAPTDDFSIQGVVVGLLREHVE